MTQIIIVVAAMLALLTPSAYPAYGNPGTIVAAPAEVILPAGGG